MWNTILLAGNAYITFLNHDTSYRNMLIIYFNLSSKYLSSALQIIRFEPLLMYINIYYILLLARISRSLNTLAEKIV